MALEFKNHKKAKENLPVCTVYGYVCKLKFAMKFKILERRRDDIGRKRKATNQDHASFYRR